VDKDLGLSIIRESRIIPQFLPDNLLHHRIAFNLVDFIYPFGSTDNRACDSSYGAADNPIKKRILGGFFAYDRIGRS
jgi:hypothetical protein